MYIFSALTNHFGCRPVAMMGGLLSSFGFLLSRYMPNLPCLYLTFGVLSGMGLALNFNSAIVSVTYYFEKKRSLATGLCVCGSGIGTFLFAPFVDFLLNEFQWRGTLLILSGVLLNMVVFGEFPPNSTIID